MGWLKHFGNHQHSLIPLYVSRRIDITADHQYDWSSIRFLRHNHKPAICMGMFGNPSPKVGCLQLYLGSPLSGGPCSWLGLSTSLRLMLQVSYFKWTRNGQGRDARIFHDLPSPFRIRWSVCVNGPKWSEWKVDAFLGVGAEWAWPLDLLFDQFMKSWITKVGIAISAFLCGELLSKKSEEKSFLI